jgi:hypothetical protein
MSVRHKGQRSGQVSIPDAVFKVRADGTLDPVPTESQREYLLKFPSLFESPTAKKPVAKKPASKKHPAHRAK